MSKLFKSVTIGSLLSAVVTFVVGHIDPSAITSPVGQIVIGIVGTVIGVVTHHNTTSSTPS